MPRGNSRANKIALLRSQMSDRIADTLGVDMRSHSELDALIAATGLAGLDSSIRLAEMHIRTHAAKIRRAAEEGGTDAAIALWNQTFPDGLEATLYDLIDKEASTAGREALEELYHSYIEAMRAELDPPEDEKKDDPEEDSEAVEAAREVAVAALEDLSLYRRLVATMGGSDHAAEAGARAE